MADWKSQLGKFYEDEKQKAISKAEQQEQTQSKVSVFLNAEVVPAFDELKIELEKHGRTVSTHRDNDSVSISVSFDGNEELRMKVKINGASVAHETRFRDKDTNKPYVAEGMFLGDSGKSHVHTLRKEDIIMEFLKQYKSNVSR